MNETCPCCGSDSGHYHSDSDKPGVEIWFCESCYSTYRVRV